MSWSVNFIGTPDKIKSALEKHSEKLSGRSKKEFDAALPHLVGLIIQNYNKTLEPVLQIIAAGHSSEQNYNTCNVDIKLLNGNLV